MKQLLIIPLLSLLACSQSSTPERAEPPHGTASNEKKAAIKTFDIHPGMTRAAIESELGAPFSIEESVRGLEITYMPGMGDMMRDLQSQMAAAQGAGQTMGILNSVAGMAGALGGPAGGIIAGAGTSIIGAGASTFATANQPTMPDMTKMEMFMVQYQNGVAVSVRRQSMGGLAPEVPLDE